MAVSVSDSVQAFALAEINKSECFFQGFGLAGVLQYELLYEPYDIDIVQHIKLKLMGSC